MTNLAKKIINEMTEEEQQTLRSWAGVAYVIRNDESLTRNEKIKKLSSITSKNKIILNFFKNFFKLIKRYTWDKRGWPARMALAGLTLGAVAGGSKMAGIVTSGMGIGVPIYILSSAGGALLGTIMQEIKKQ